MPALFTSTSRSPASSTKRFASSTLETSAWTARPPSSDAIAAASSAPDRYPTTTVAPACASSRATAAPIPREPPVTRAVFPSRDANSGTQCFGDFVERLQVVHREGLDRSVDPLQ